MNNNNLQIFFSVVIPTYNRVDSLKRCLNSLNVQTYSNFEVIVVDDNSTEVISDFIKPDNYIFELKIIKNKINLGPAGSRNQGILNSKYEWEAFLDDDDEWISNKLEVISKRIYEHPETDFIFHDSIIVMKNENTRYTTKKSVHQDYFKALLIKNVIGGTPMVIVKRSLFEKHGNFDTSLPALEDYEMWLRFSKYFKPLYLSEALSLCNYTTSSKSVSKSIKNNIHGLSKIYLKYQDEYAKLSHNELYEKKEWEYSLLAHKCLLNYQRINAMKFYFKAFWVNKRVKFLLTSIISFIYPKLIFKLR